MTKRIKLTTNDQATAYLSERGYNVSRFDKVDAEGNAYFTTTETCNRCGGAGYYPTPRHGACYECGGQPPRYTVAHTAIGVAKKMRKSELRQARNVRKHAAKQEAAAEKAAAERVAFDAAYPGFADLLAPFTNDEGILGDFASKLSTWGSLSEKQVAVAQRIIAERNAPKGTLEGGRREVSGKIVSCKWRDSQWGGAYKITVDLGDGTRIWGTAPSALLDAASDHYHANEKTSATFYADEVLKGATVTFTATITVSDDDPSFGFYKRPSCPTLDSVAWVAPEPEDVRCDFCDGAHPTHECPGEAAHCERVEADH